MAFVFPMLVPFVYTGIDEGWWGSHRDLGDGWQAAAAIMTVAGLLAVALAIFLAKLVALPRRHP